MIKTLFSVLIPESLRRNHAQYVHAKTLAGISIASACASPFFSGLYYYLYLPDVGFYVGLEGLIILFSILSLKVHRSLFISREIIVFSFILLIFWVSIRLGGIIAPSTYWFILPPLICLICGGLQTGVIWTVVIVIILTGLYFFNGDLALVLIRQPYFLPILFLSLIGLIFVISAVAYFAEKNRIRTLNLRYRAYHDPLTGALNRYAFEERLNQALKKQKPLALVHIDINNFSAVNNTLGFTVGDLLLQEVMRRIVAFMPSTSSIARTGNDEFSVFFHSKTLFRTTKPLSQLLSQLKEPYLLHPKHEVISSCSMGVTLYPEDAKDMQTLIRYANLALSRAKYFDGNNIQFFNQQMAKQDLYLLAIQEKLPLALRRNEFYLHYQPQYSTTSNVITGLEALLRWKQPELGLVPPDIFIPIAEQMGLISEIGDWVIYNALTQYKAWLNRRILSPATVISVNLSVQQLRVKDVLEQIKNMLLKTQVPPECLEIEITESVFLHEKTSTLKTLSAIKDQGIAIALDDFGTGYSSLGFLHDVPLSRLKMDKIFLQNKQKREKLIPAIIKLAHQFNLDVVAEGVETKEQLDFLITQQCDYVQGFYLSQPLSIDDIELLLSKK